MLCGEKVDIEIKRLRGILGKRGALFEDEQTRLDAMESVAAWLLEDKQDAERIEMEAAAAEEQERLNSPEYKTRELFRGVKVNVPPKGHGR